MNDEKILKKNRKYQWLYIIAFIIEMITKATRAS